MPIEYRIDHARQLVIARGHGLFTEADIFGYQREVWTDPVVAGYDELVDMSAVEDVSAPNPASQKLQHLAAESAACDLPTGGRLAICAPSPLTFGLARAYQTYRELNPKTKKQVGVFRTLPEALAFLGIDQLEAPSDRSPS